MPISRTPLIHPFPVWADDVEDCQGSVDRFSSLPTATEIRQRYLFGLPLISSLTGEKLTDDAIDFYIKSAISELEHTLDIYITPVQFTEKHDYIRENFTWNYNYLKTNHTPILYVQKMELTFNNANVPGFVNFPLEFVHVMPQEGVLQLVPAFGTAMSGFMQSSFSGTQFHALHAVGMLNFPGGVRVTYTAGFEHCKIPAAIVQLIGTIAAVNLLSMMGPLLFPANSTSIGIDGVSQSVSSLGPKYFNDRITQLMAERDRQMEAVKGYYIKRYLLDYF